MFISARIEIKIFELVTDNMSINTKRFMFWFEASKLLLLVVAITLEHDGYDVVDRDDDDNVGPVIWSGMSIF